MKPKYIIFVFAYASHTHLLSLHLQGRDQAQNAVMLRFMDRSFAEFTFQSPVQKLLGVLVGDELFSHYNAFLTDETHKPLDTISLIGNTSNELYSLAPQALTYHFNQLTLFLSHSMVELQVTILYTIRTKRCFVEPCPNRMLAQSLQT